MNLNYLLYFKTLAKYEHYGKAAEELHITQPSLSKAIRNLEQDLGVELFEKSGRGIRLSSQGVHYLDYVDKALHELRLGNEILRYEKASFDASSKKPSPKSLANLPSLRNIISYGSLSSGK